MATKRIPAFRNGPSLPPDPEEKRRAKNPANDPLAALKAATIETDYRREINKGLFARPAWAFHELAKIQSMLGDKVRFWTAQIGGLEYSVKMADDAVGDDAEPKRKAKAEAQKAVLTGIYEKIDNLKQAIKHLAGGRFYGFSVLRRSGMRLDPIQPWNAIHNIEWSGGTAPSMKWYWNPEARTSYQSDMAELVAPEWIVHERDDSSILELMRLAFRATAIMDFREKNLEAASKNQVLILTGANLPDETTTEGLNLIAALKLARNGESSVIAKGDPSCPTEVIKPEAAKGLPFYDSALRSIDELMTKAVTGGMLTMLSMPTGIGSGASDTHSDSLQALLADEASDISEFFQRYIDKPALIAANLMDEGERPLAWFMLSPKAKVDAQGGANLLATLKTAGYEVDEGQAGEVVDLTVTKAEAPEAKQSFFGNSQALANRAATLEYAEAKKLAGLDSGFFDFLDGLAKEYGGDGKVDPAWLDAIETAIVEAPPESFVDSETFQKYMEQAMAKAWKMGEKAAPEVPASAKE